MEYSPAVLVKQEVSSSNRTEKKKNGKRMKNRLSLIYIGGAGIPGL